MPVHPTLCAISLALGANPGFYHPDQVGPLSTLFSDASGRMAARFDSIQAEMAEVSPHLVALDRSAALASRRAPVAFSSYAADLRRDANGQTHRVQAFVDLLVVDFENTFQAAMQRALPVVGAGREVVQCRSGGIHALLGRTSCAGEDLNPALARAMDRDPALIAAVAEIDALEWPSFQVEGRVQPVMPLSGVGNHLRLIDLAEALLPAQLAAAQARFDEALEPLEVDLEEAESPTVRREALDRARSVRDLYERELGLLGEDLFVAVQASLERQQRNGAPAAVGICANPPGLGGCTGKDVTEEVLPLLLADRRLVRDLAE